MTKLTFSGEFYSGEDCLFTGPGEVEVRDGKAEQLLRDFPDQFARVSPPAPEKVEKTDPVLAEVESKPADVQTAKPVDAKTTKN